MVGEALLSVRGVGKAYGGVRALSGVSLTVPRGGITGLVGPNGSGKSTLFDVVTGHVACDTGEVEFDGASLRGLAPHEVARRGLVRTFQLTRIFPSLTVAENLLIFADRGASGEAKAREMLAFLGLTKLATREAAGLSYGQQKLLEIAQVLMLDPRMVMLDEPMAGINPGLADELAGHLAELRERGTTLLLVEHNIPIVRELCDTVVVLSGGKVMASGRPAEVLADSEVREAFLGD